MQIVVSANCKQNFHINLRNCANICLSWSFPNQKEVIFWISKLDSNILRFYSNADENWGEIPTFQTKRESSSWTAIGAYIIVSGGWDPSMDQ